MDSNHLLQTQPTIQPTDHNKDDSDQSCGHKEVFFLFKDEGGDQFTFISIENN
jgi:hypothetical protein